MNDAMLEIKDLTVSFHDPAGPNGADAAAVNGVSLSVAKQSFTSIVGESGSGKTVTALSVTRLLKPHLISGMINYKPGDSQSLDLLKIPQSDLLRIRGREIAYIFQDPASSLNPVMKIGEQMTECCRVHFASGNKLAIKESLEYLSAVRMRDPERVFRSFPHELSGGMRQRVMIAMALIMRPRLLIADEPTTALDVTTEAEIMELLMSFRRQKKLTILFITHNLSLAASFSDEIHVMQKGRVIECLKKDVSGFKAKEAYTRKLFNAQLFGSKPKTLIEV